MKTRTCPNCGYKYPLKEYYKNFLFNIVLREWSCKSCSTQITINKSRRLLSTLVGILPYFAIRPLSKFVSNNSGAGEITVALVLYLFLVVFVLIVNSLLDTFSIVSDGRVKSESETVKLHDHGIWIYWLKNKFEITVIL